MSEKYAIKNCPACKMFNVFGQDDKPCCYNEMKYCEDVENCLLKQIVEKCKERYVGYLEDARVKDEILQMLEIEECEQ